MRWRGVARRWTAALRTALVLACAFALAGGARAAPVEDHQIKAVFLYNFANFITWPSRAFDGPQGAIRYCVLGDALVAETLDKTLRGETVNGRPLVLQRAQEPADLKGCHVVYLGAARRDRLAEVLRALEGSTVLTVSDIDGFAERGGIIGLVRENARMRLVINASALARASLTASSKLLSLAVLVGARE